MISYERARVLANVRNLTVNDVLKFDEEWDKTVESLKKYDLSNIKIVPKEKD